MWSSSLPRVFSKAVFCFLLFLSLSALAHEKRITLFCPNVPRKEAILVAAFQAGEEVVFFTDVPGTITLRRESVPFEEALTLILEGTGILWHRKDGVYYIGTPEEGTPEYMAISDVEPYHSRFRTAQEFLTLHPEFAGKLLPVSPFRFLIAGPEKIRERIKKVIGELDHPREHILVQAALFAKKGERTESLTYSLPDTYSFTLAPHQGREEKLQGTLKAQEKEQYSSLRAIQEILVLEGEWGEGWAGQQAYYTVEETLKVIELGTGIRARPTYLGDGRIQVELEVRTAKTEKADPFTVVQRIFTASVVLKEGETVPVALLEEKRKVERARKLFENAKRKGPVTEEEEEGDFVLVVSAKREHPESLPSLVHLEGPPLVVEGKERNHAPSTQVFLEYRTPGLLGIGFVSSLEGTVHLTGSLYRALEGASFFGTLELSFPLEDHTCLGVCWKWTEKGSGWLLFFESENKGLFLRAGGGNAGPHGVGFVSLGGEYREGAFSLKGTLTYQMSSKAQNLRLDLEGQWRIRKNTFLVAGYGGILLGKRTPLDDLRFEGFFVGLRITF